MYVRSPLCVRTRTYSCCTVITRCHGNTPFQYTTVKVDKIIVCLVPENFLRKDLHEKQKNSRLSIHDVRSSIYTGIKPRGSPSHS